MPASPLILGQSQRTDLAHLREQAVADPIDVAAVLEQTKTAQGLTKHQERMKTFTIPIPTAFMVTYTIETGHPSGPCRHLSMSSVRHGRAPTPDAIWMIASELGFVGALDQCMVWPEDIGAGDKAINIVQPISVIGGKHRRV
jgi:hypothetical protein